MTIGGKLIGVNNQSNKVYVVTQDNADEIIAQNIEMYDVLMDFAIERDVSQIKNEDSTPISQEDFYVGIPPAELADWSISTEIRFIP